MAVRMGFGLVTILMVNRNIVEDIKTAKGMVAGIRKLNLGKQRNGTLVSSKMMLEYPIRGR